ALARPGRALIGIAGPPGAGKSTLAERLVTPRRAGARWGTMGRLHLSVATRGPAAAWVPMDGFPLADAALDRLGLRDRKGAPETFDGWGYLALLRRLATATDHPVGGPGCGRPLEHTH